jgi:MFS family permease
MHMTKKELSLGILAYILAALFLVYEMAIQVSPSVMTAQLMRDFGIGAAELGWMSSVYYYSYTIMQIPAGLLFDRFGPRTLLTAASFICAFGILFFSLTKSVYPAAIGRFLMGIGSSFAFIGVLVVTSRWFDKKYFPTFVGLTMFLASAGAIAGEVPLADAVEAFGWRDLMWGLMIVGFVLGGTYILFLRDHPRHEFADGNSHEHSIFSHLCKVMRKGQSWFCAIYAFTGWGPIIMFAALWGIPYLSVRFHLSAYDAAFGTMMMWLGCGVSSPFVGFLSSKMKRRKPLLWVGSILGFVSFSMVLLIPSLTFLHVSILLFFAGLGTSAHILTFALVRDNNPPSIVGSSLGFNNMAVVIGGAILQPISGFILNYYWDGVSKVHGVPVYTLQAYERSLLLIPVLYFIGFLVSFFFIKETRCKNTYAEE